MIHHFRLRPTAGRSGAGRPGDGRRPIGGDDAPRPAPDHWAGRRPKIGIVQGFRRDRRLDEPLKSLKRLGVRDLRTGLGRPDRIREDVPGRFDRQRKALQDFDRTVTFCFTPQHLGLAPHHMSAPIDPLHFSDFVLR